MVTVVFTVLAALSGMERKYSRDRIFKGQESARKHGNPVAGTWTIKATVRASGSDQVTVETTVTIRR